MTSNEGFIEWPEMPTLSDEIDMKWTDDSTGVNLPQPPPPDFPYENAPAG